MDDQDEKAPNHDEVLNKLDALLNKHRTPFTRPRQAAIPSPVTEAKPTVSPIPTLTEIVGHTAALDTIPTLTQVVPTSDTTTDTLPLAPQSTTELPHTAQANLSRIIAENLERRIMPQLTQHLDQSLKTLLAQFREEITQLVRESLAQELQQYFDVIVSDLQRHDNDNR